MKTAISLPDALFEAAEQFARRSGMSRSELFQTALRNYLSAHRDDDVTDALNSVYAGESGLDPALSAAQFATLPDENWD